MITKENLRWLVKGLAKNQNKEIRKGLSTDQFDGVVSAIKDATVGYLSSNHKCYTIGPKTFIPMGCPSINTSGKCFKVKVALPGRGKSSCLRIAMKILLDQNQDPIEVILAGLWERNTEPSKEEFDEAFRLV